MHAKLAFALVAAALSAAAQQPTHRDIVFATPAKSEPLKLDVHVPNGPGPFPTAILVHGGGWVGGSKQEFINYIFEPLSKANFVWFSINYRLAPHHRWPACAEDVETAIQWVFANAAKYKVDPTRVALIGESSGGHLASYAGIKTRQPLAAIVSFYGVHDFISRAFQYARIDSNLTSLFGIGTLNSETAVVLREASPFAHVRKGLPPFLMIHGLADPAVPYAQSVDMCAKLRAAGNACELYSVNGPHGMDRWEMDPTLQGYKQKLVDWLRATLKVK
jgi:alpha-L-fucosidase 2